MNDDQILMAGGTEDDIRSIAEQNGATDPTCTDCGQLHHSMECPTPDFPDRGDNNDKGDFNH